MNSLYVGPLSAFIVTLLAMIALRPVAVAIDLIDKPGGRKTHDGEIPIVGGMAMFLGFAFGATYLPSSAGNAVSVLSAAAVLVTIGLLDDRFDLSPWARLPLQLIAPLIVFGGELATLRLSFGDPVGIGPIVVDPWFSIAVLVLLVAGAVNAFNMMDGMDGLAGTIALVGCLGIACLSAARGQEGALVFSLLISGVVCAFLVFNLPLNANRSIRCFMGDSGSTLLGFLLALLCLRISQQVDADSVSPMSLLWVVAMPIYELLWTMIRRIGRGQSPFRPDREHLHHLLLDAGVSVRATFLIYACIAGLLALVGILFDAFDAPDSLSFAAFVATGIGTVFSFYRAGLLARSLPLRLQRSPSRPHVQK
jgi:UDP-GlcNAc:undecaprenyl-phosphate GlcNAc-1-phosphate transferase